MNLEQFNDKYKGLFKFYGVDSMLVAMELMNGTIRLTETICSTFTSELNQQIDFIIANGIKELKIVISSNGGEAYSAFGIFDKLQEARAKGIKVTGHVEGAAASAASMIVLQACDHRTASARSRIHLHEVSKWIFMSDQKMSQVEEELQEMKALTTMVIDNLAKRTGKKEDELNEFIKRRERWMSAQEALDYNLIDEIV